MEDLGNAIRAARVAKGLSLRAVAAEADISPSLLSQVETGKTQPSVGTLYTLVNVLGVSLDDLLGIEHAPQAAPGGTFGPLTVAPVQRREDNPTIVMENGVTWERLAIDGHGTVDALLTTYEPGGGSSVEGKMMRHSGIEYGYIIEGELTLQLDFDTYVLKAGDSVCFDSLRPHLYQNNTDQTVRGLWFVLGHAAENANGPAPAGGYAMNSAVDVLGALSRIPAGAAGRIISPASPSTASGPSNPSPA